MNYLTEFDLYIDIVLILYIFYSKNFSSIKKLMKENREKVDAQRGITNK